jgi:small subunit ribosomal protein S16
VAVKIRLTRLGRKKRPYYRIVAVDERKRRDGAYIDRIGIYDPVSKPSVIQIDHDLALKWLNDGAQISDTVRNLFRFDGVLLRWDMSKRNYDQVKIEEAVKEHRERRFGVEMSKIEEIKKAELAKREKALKEAEEAEKKALEEAEAAAKAQQQAKAAEAVKTEEAPAEEAKAAEAVKTEEAPAEEAKAAEAVKTEEAPAEEPKAEETPSAEAKSEEPKAEQAKAEEPAAEAAEDTKPDAGEKSE